MEAEACVLPLSEAEENYDHLDIGQLVTVLWRRSCTTTTTSNVGTPSLTTVQKWFSARGFDLYLAGGDNDCGMVQIMYQAKRASSIDWRPRWTRQCRGVILQLPIPTTSDKNKSDYHVRIVRYLLQRGEEVMTSLHNNNNTNHHNRQPGNAVPDDVRATTTSRFARLDDNQQETIRQLQAGKEIVGEVTMKVDGMLCAYTFYRGTSAKDVWNLLLSAANDNDDGPNFALAMAAACRQAHKDYITVLSTQRTIFLRPHQDDKHHHPSLAGTTTTPADAVQVFASQIIEAMDGFYNNEPDDDTGKSTELSQSISLEAVCAANEEDGYSTCAWGYAHSELALSYNQSFVAVLGQSQGLVSRPHYTFSAQIQTLGFVEPLWWKVSHTQQIDQLLLDLTQVAEGNLDQEAFLQKQPPMNSTNTTLSSDTMASMLHLEGFVFYAATAGGDGRHYTKIKLPLYYILHAGHNDMQIPAQHIPNLTRIGRANPRLSAKARATATWFDSLLVEQLEHVCKDILQHAGNSDDHPLDENGFYQNLGPAEQRAAQHLWERASNNDKARDKLWHIFISPSASTAQSETYVVRRMFDQNMPALSRTKVKDQKVNKLLRLLMYDIRPWECHSCEHIACMVNTFHPLILELYTALTWTNKKMQHANVNILAYFHIGCPESTDADIMVQLNSPQDVDRASRGEIDPREHISTMTGIPQEKLDLNCFYVDPATRRARLFSKGNRNLSSNILFYTLGLHKQTYPDMPICQPEPVDLADMIRGFVLFVLKELKLLVGATAYEKVRTARVGAYAAKGGSARRDFVLAMLDYIGGEDWDDNGVQFRDVMKSLTLKSIQILSLHHCNMCPFVKAEMVQACESMLPGRGSEAEYFLFWGRRGTPSPDFLPALMAALSLAIRAVSADVEWHVFPVEWTQKNPSAFLPDGLFHAFWEDPTHPTETFSDLYRFHGGTEVLQSWFQLQSKNTDLIPTSVATVVLEEEDGDNIPGPSSCPVVFTMPQRSQAWHRIRERFPNSRVGATMPTKRNSTADDDVEKHFHFFRGCLVEMSVTAHGNFSAIPGLEGFALIMVGCVIDAKRKTNQSPDFLLVKKVKHEDDRIILVPGEIKCSPCPFRDNSELRRSLQQARRQLRGVCDMFGLPATQGLLVLVNIHKGASKNVVIESRASLLDLSNP